MKVAPQQQLRARTSSRRRARAAWRSAGGPWSLLDCHLRRCWVWHLVLSCRWCLCPGSVAVNSSCFWDGTLKASLTECIACKCIRRCWNLSILTCCGQALRVLKSLQIHGVILGGWAKLHELAEQLASGNLAEQNGYVTCRWLTCWHVHFNFCKDIALLKRLAQCYWNVDFRYIL